MTIEYLFHIKGISVRAHNVCFKNRLHDIDDLRDYYSIHKSFLMLILCGKSVNNELIEICKLNRSICNCEFVFHNSVDSEYKIIENLEEDSVYLSPLIS